MWRGGLRVRAVCLEGEIKEQGVCTEKGVLGMMVVGLVKFGV